jgi:hypothetical protein
MLDLLNAAEQAVEEALAEAEDTDGGWDVVDSLQDALESIQYARKFLPTRS